MSSSDGHRKDKEEEENSLGALVRALCKLGALHHPPPQEGKKGEKFGGLRTSGGVLGREDCSSFLHIFCQVLLGKNSFLPMLRFHV